MSIVHTKVELPDGRTLECEYSLHVTRGVHTLSNGDPGYPDEWDVGDPVFWIEGCQMELEDMPTHIAQIAQRLYMDDPHPRDIAPDPEPDCEPDEPEYIF